MGNSCTSQSNQNDIASMKDYYNYYPRPLKECQKQQICDEHCDDVFEEYGNIFEDHYSIDVNKMFDYLMTVISSNNLLDQSDYYWLNHYLKKYKKHKIYEEQNYYNKSSFYKKEFISKINILIKNQKIKNNIVYNQNGINKILKLYNIKIHFYLYDFLFDNNNINAQNIIYGYVQREIESKKKQCSIKDVQYLDELKSHIIDPSRSHNNISIHNIQKSIIYLMQSDNLMFTPLFSILTIYIFINS